MNTKRKHNKRSSKVTYNRGSRKTKSGSSRRKTKYMKSRGKGKYILCIIIFLFIIITLYKIMPDAIYIKSGLDEYDDERVKQLIREVLEENEELSQKEAEEAVINEIKNSESNSSNNVQVTSRGGISSRSSSSEKSLGKFRITSYHPGDACLSGTKTGSGKTIDDFKTMKIGNKNVYTYKGKIVVACATEELLASGYNVKGGGTRQEGKHYFRYYDEIKLNIDGTYYDAIVLDSCGAAMWTNEKRIDIFVPSSDNVVNRSSVEAFI